jgi:hypothetical protein
MDEGGGACLGGSVWANEIRSRQSDRVGQDVPGA